MKKNPTKNEEWSLIIVFYVNAYIETSKANTLKLCIYS